MRTLLIVKPGWKRYPGLLFGIGAFIRVKNLDICLEHTTIACRKFWEEFYQSHSKAPYFEEMINYLTSSKYIFMILDGDLVVKSVRERVIEIRARYGKKGKDTKNVLHASDSEENAQKEIDLVIDFLAHDRLQV